VVHLVARKYHFGFQIAFVAFMELPNQVESFGIEGGDYVFLAFHDVVLDIILGCQRCDGVQTIPPRFNIRWRLVESVDLRKISFV